MASSHSLQKKMTWLLETKRIVIERKGSNQKGHEEYVQIAEIHDHKQLLNIA